jgi:hypothetical protein
MPAAALRHPRVRPEPASKERVVKLRQKMSAGNRRVLFVPLPASFLWARILVKKWTRSAAAQRARRPCPAGLKLALGQGEHVASRSSGSRFAESPGAQGPGRGSRPRRQHPGPTRHPTRNAQERSVAASPIATTARAQAAPAPPPQTDTGSPTIADAWPRSPIPAQTARSRRAGRVDLC